MNILASECSSGCESGWTLYLDQSYGSPNGSHSHRGDGKVVDKCKGKKGKQEHEEEEDLSMVSDASSGPPHYFHEEENYSNDNVGFFFPPNKNAVKKKKSRGSRHLVDPQQPAFLDDTASSPAFNYPMQNNYNFTSRRTPMDSVLEFSQDMPTPFEGRSAYQSHYGFMQSSFSGNQAENSQWLTRGGWE